MLKHGVNKERTMKKDELIQALETHLQNIDALASTQDAESWKDRVLFSLVNSPFKDSPQYDKIKKYSFSLLRNSKSGMSIYPEFSDSQKEGAKKIISECIDLTKSFTPAGEEKVKTDNDIIDIVLKYLYDNASHKAGVNITEKIEETMYKIDSNRKQRITLKIVPKLADERESINATDTFGVINDFGIFIQDEFGSYSAYMKSEKEKPTESPVVMTFDNSKHQHFQAGDIHAPLTQIQSESASGSNKIDNIFQATKPEKNIKKILISIVKWLGALSVAIGAAYVAYKMGWV